MKYDIQDDTGDHEEEEKIYLEAGEDGLMKNTSQQGRCHDSHSGTWKWQGSVFRNMKESH